MYNDKLQNIRLYVFNKAENKTDDLIRICVDEYLGLRSEEYERIDVVRGEFGAPNLKQEGLPYISVSHSGKYTVCALSDNRLGIDLQLGQLLRNETVQEYCARLLRIAKRFFHPSDTRWIEQDLVNRFFTVWSAKESYVKYTQKGIDDTFASVRVIPDGGPFATAWECDGMHYSVLPFEEGYSLCVCSEYPSETEIEFVF
jgi:phosphopantetheinyl transferase